MNSSFAYLPPKKRKKIMLITDDIRVHSGVATVGREIVIHTAQHFNWVNIGGAVKHPDEGKRMDLSEDTNKTTGLTDSSVTLYPVSGYGNPNILRQLIEIEQPDAIMLITDPRYFVWLFQMENEIRRKIPIVYLNIWDDYPAPLYNKPYYEACDLLMGISKQTVNINQIVLGDKGKNKLFKYIPHGLNHEVYKPLGDDNSDLVEFRKNMFGSKEMDFILFFNSRNIRRKQIPDTLLAYRYFLDQLPKEKAERCAFVLHTELVSDHGTDLMAVKELLLNESHHNVFFSTGKLDNKSLNLLYNVADAQILLTSNEGWGLSITEAILAGTPIIANVTGGMQDQMRFVDENSKWFTPSPEIPSNHTGKYRKHGEWAFPVYPTNRSIQGSPQTPYIWDDRCSPVEAADRIMELYNMTREERKALGLKGREWAISEEAGFTGEIQGKRVIESIDELFETWTPREKFEFINTNEVKDRVNTHNLLY
jgi:glycosyltransferase involved in cell wall biosynthesis